MAKVNYSDRLDALKNRRTDSELIKKAYSADSYEVLLESYDNLNETKLIKYIVGAMMPVDLKYTNKSFGEGERVKNHLQNLIRVDRGLEFKYQGSVTNNTHIKAHSDIDILTIHNGFITLEKPQHVSSPYDGNPIHDLCCLREDSFRLLRTAFPAATIDNSGAKSISLSGGSLQRKVDVVPSNWYNTVKYAETMLDYFRGVMVLDYANKTRIANTPFYHNQLLEVKDQYTQSNFKKVVRLLKVLKADADVKIDLSSYDITALIYHMDNSNFLIHYSPLKLLENTLRYLEGLYANEYYRNSLYVPDQSRKIFQNGAATLNGLKLLIIELNNVYADLLEDLVNSRSSINKQIIA